VISLHISHNIHSREAFAREAAMIEAIGRVSHTGLRPISLSSTLSGIENLTNIVKGSAKSLPRHWTKKQLTEVGLSTRSHRGVPITRSVSFSLVHPYCERPTLCSPTSDAGRCLKKTWRVWR
jgi:hypothetical protein